MDFKDLHFAVPLADAVKQSGYAQPTQIQQQAIPHLLEGKNLLGLAQTGTGKTAAFLLPTIQKLLTQPGKGIRALVLVPTRELAEQVFTNALQLSRFTHLRCCTVYGGVSKGTQLKKIDRGVDIVIACPGRLLDHINAKNIDLSSLDTLILDEADQMCDKGFLPDVRRIIRHVPENRQTMVFSATMPKEVRGFVENILINPVTIQIDHTKPSTAISHTLFQVAKEKKTELLKELLRLPEIHTALVFTRTKYKAKNLGAQLLRQGFAATSLQGNMSQNQRTTAMNGFRNGQFNILIATDIAARGIDVSGISHVINYDVPETVEAYTHRVGRTGRARKTGKALTFVTREDNKIIRMVENQLGKIFSNDTTEYTLEKKDTDVLQSDRNIKTDKRSAKRKSTADASGKSKAKGKGKRPASFDFGLKPKNRGRRPKKVQPSA